MSGAKQALQELVTKFPSSDYASSAQQVTVILEKAEKAGSSQPISYIEFYAKAHTGLTVGQRYRFVAAINQNLCLKDSPDNSTHFICARPEFDNDANYESLLRGPGAAMTTIVASMDSDGHIKIHSVQR